MEIKGIITEKDYLSAQYLHIKPRFMFSVVGIILLTLAVFTLIVQFSFSLLVCFVALIVLFFAYLPFKAKQAYRSYAALSEPVEISIQEDGLKFTSKRGEGVVYWSDIRKLKHNSKLALVYPADNIFHLIPAHFFYAESEFRQFVSQLNEHCKSIT